MRIFFMNPNPRDPSAASDGAARSQEINRSYGSPGTEIDFGQPEDYAGSQVLKTISSENALPGLHHVISTTNFIRKVVWAQEQGYDAVIQSNTFDPGIEAARYAVRIPVIGVMRVALHTAAVLSHRIAVTVPFQSHVHETWRIIRSYGMEHFIVDIRPIGMYPGNMGTAKNLENASIEVMKAMAKDSSAEYIVPLGGALIPYVVDPKVLEEAVGVPVLNTKIAAIRFAEMCVNAGMSQSYIAYPRVESVAYEDFNRAGYSK